MGMYTELILGCALSRDLPDVCEQALDKVINNVEPDEEDAEEVKKFIQDYSLEYLFHCGSYYFGVNWSPPMFRFDEFGKDWRISTRANLKNYDNEIEKFLKYLRPYVKQGSGYSHEIFAYVQYEESPLPTLYGVDGIINITDFTVTAY